jgi:hypothetical protein
VGTTYAPDVIQSIKLGRQPAMNTEKLLVHDGSEGERAERVHAGLVQALRIFTLTCMRRRSGGYNVNDHADSHSSLNVK